MAARNRTSRMVILGVGVGFLLVVGAGAWRVVSGPPGSPDPGSAEPSVDRLTGTGPGAGEAMADRPGETVQALAADLENLKSTSASISESVAAGLGGLGDRLQQFGDELTALRTEQASLADDAGGEAESAAFRDDILASVQAMFDGFEARTGADYPVGGSPAPGAGRGIPGADGLVWYAAASPEPIGGAALPGGIASLPEQLASLSGSSLGLENPGDTVPGPLPVYTIPADATLVRSRGLTALIGRVPSEGQVLDPFPFKIITGRDNLLANGQTLPELEQAIWSGTATGDATLHCVTGQLRQVTFIFRDGSISTWPEEGGGTGARGIGWISNEQGYPCIPGKFVSNLRENIAGITSAAFGSSLARAWSEQQTTTIRDGAAVTRSITGNPGEYALGQGIAGGISEWARIVAERAREAYDAVVVSPGQVLTVHVAQAIPIDWPPVGRRVRHGSSLSPAGAMHKPGGLD